MTQIVTGPVVTQEAPARVVSSVTTAPATVSSSYLLKKAAEWTWEDLRNYVVAAITERFGAPDRDPLKESTIFKAFMGRHGALNAVIIATAAFEVYGGIWRNAPVAVTRFTKNNDPYFAEVILARWNA